MANRLLIIAVGLTAFLAVPMSAEAVSAGFCAYGFCAGVDANGLGAAAYARLCTNFTGIGCCPVIPGLGCPVPMNPLIIPAPVPAIPFVIGCQAVFAPQELSDLGVPTGGTVVSVCV